MIPVSTLSISIGQKVRKTFFEFIVPHPTSGSEQLG